MVLLRDKRLLISRFPQGLCSLFPICSQGSNSGSLRLICLGLLWSVCCHGYSFKTNDSVAVTVTR